ncbi:LysR family transcriptional regulator [Wenxinia saemankumensis]|uniref:Transcriptional regulator, LysR family n=1 Tax=Wenxinia saemankumensis TaxID=1447782 RepID=A0A1M6GTK2_9RHOB|nr:LysR family transcriptional regulator [Wenxinia saemankumensis]SHJ13283.1 transcriptional regulator, LysR family [Wenxinia saemankumensis]
MKNWDEVRTAYFVARAGTVSGAADALGVHHATVIRHIDALEARLGVKLFQRHARGYTPTEAGADLLQVGQATDDQFNQLESRIRGRGESVSGDLTVTTLTMLAPLMVPVLHDFQQANSGLIVRYLVGARLFRLEYGEAHVAIRAGAPPEQPDNVVRKLSQIRPALYAAPGYLARHGRPERPEDTDGHLYVGPDDEGSRAPFHAWMARNVPREQVVFRTGDDTTGVEAVRAGAGIGFLTGWQAEGLGLERLCDPREDWAADLWVVTHVDLHRTTKVQAFLAALREAVATWPE